jgi:S1-C subfamily serine protease
MGFYSSFILHPSSFRGGDRRRSILAGFGDVVAACGVLVLIVCAGAETMGAQQPGPRSRPENHSRAGIGARAGREGAAEPARGPGADVARRRPALPSDDGTYRPTVLVRRGTAQGSGTIIASVEGETLVLTAAHVVHDRGPIVVELHRYNIGRERAAGASGPWPRTVRAALLAADTAADLAILRIEKMRALPYVARLARDHTDPPADSIVTSIGIDLGTNLTGWPTRLVETLTFELNGSRDPRPFLITEKIPEHGRSGGGLYLANGELVGVCVGHAKLVKGKEMGVFASRESIRLLLNDHKLTAAIVRSETRRARLRGRSPQVNTAARAPSDSVVTPTRSIGEKKPTPNVP